jgi:alpha-ketoglutarate-dependent 2,4-dichlorophenoxyacetate dioxygenase
MPVTISSSAPFKTIMVKQLHSTFGAEVVGADFTNMTDEQFDEIKQAMAQVGSIRFPVVAKADLS